MHVDVKVNVIIDVLVFILKILPCDALSAIVAERVTHSSYKARVS